MEATMALALLAVSGLAVYLVSPQAIPGTLFQSDFKDPVENGKTTPEPDLAEQVRLSLMNNNKRPCLKVVVWDNGTLKIECYNPRRIRQIAIAASPPQTPAPTTTANGPKTTAPTATIVLPETTTTKAATFAPIATATSSQPATTAKPSAATGTTQASTLTSMLVSTSGATTQPQTTIDHFRIIPRNASIPVKILVMPALGRPIRLGALYDIRSNTWYPGTADWYTIAHPKINATTTLLEGDKPVRVVGQKWLSYHKTGGYDLFNHSQPYYAQTKENHDTYALVFLSRIRRVNAFAHDELATAVKSRPRRFDEVLIEKPGPVFYSSLELNRSVYYRSLNRSLFDRLLENGQGSHMVTGVYCKETEYLVLGKVAESYISDMMKVDKNKKPREMSMQQLFQSLVKAALKNASQSENTTMTLADLPKSMSLSYVSRKSSFEPLFADYTAWSHCPSGTVSTFELTPLQDIVQMRPDFGQDVFIESRALRLSLERKEKINPILDRFDDQFARLATAQRLATQFSLTTFNYVLKELRQALAMWKSLFGNTMEGFLMFRNVGPDTKDPEYMTKFLAYIGQSIFGHKQALDDMIQASFRQVEFIVEYLKVAETFREPNFRTAVLPLPKSGDVTKDPAILMQMATGGFKNAIVLSVEFSSMKHYHDAYIRKIIQAMLTKAQSKPEMPLIPANVGRDYRGKIKSEIEKFLLTVHHWNSLNKHAIKDTLFLLAFHDVSKSKQSKIMTFGEYTKTFATDGLKVEEFKEGRFDKWIKPGFSLVNNSRNPGILEVGMKLPGEKRQLLVMTSALTRSQFDPTFPPKIPVPLPQFQVLDISRGSPLTHSCLDRNITYVAQMGERTEFGYKPLGAFCLNVETTGAVGRTTGDEAKLEDNFASWAGQGCKFKPFRGHWNPMGLHDFDFKTPSKASQIVDEALKSVFKLPKSFAEAVAKSDRILFDCAMKHRDEKKECKKKEEKRIEQLTPAEEKEEEKEEKEEAIVDPKGAMDSGMTVLAEEPAEGPAE